MCLNRYKLLSTYWHATTHVLQYITYVKTLIENFWQGRTPQKKKKRRKLIGQTLCLSHQMEANQISWLPVEPVGNSAWLPTDARSGTWHVSWPRIMANLAAAPASLSSKDVDWSSHISTNWQQYKLEPFQMDLQNPSSHARLPLTVWWTYYWSAWCQM